MNAQRISDRRMIVRSAVAALVCGSWLMAGLSVGQETKPAGTGAPAPATEVKKSAEQDKDLSAWTTQIYYLKYAKAASVAELLSDTMTGGKDAKIVPEERLNAIIVSASPEAQDQVAQMIKNLDAPPSKDQENAERDARPVVCVYRLKHAEGATVVHVLSATMTDIEGIKITADPRSGSIIVLAPRKEHDQVEQLIRVLDVPPEPGAATRLTLIYRLKYARADAIAKTLHFLLADEKWTSTTAVASETASNSLIVSASAQQQEEVEALIEKLDIPPARDVAREGEIRVFALVNAEARDVAEVITTLLGPDEKIAVDERTNSILVQGTQGTLLVIDAILTRLDETAARDLKKRGPGTTFQVRVVWLANGLSDDDAAEPSADLKDVLDPLRLMGVKDLRQVGQVIVNTTPDGQFQVRCSPVLNQRSSDLEITGEFDTRQETPTLRIQLSANQTEEVPQTDPRRKPSTGKTKTLVDLTTVIAAPLGHYVVLGVAPVEKMTSVFIVQIIASKK